MINNRCYLFLEEPYKELARNDALGSKEQEEMTDKAELSFSTIFFWGEIFQESNVIMGCWIIERLLRSRI